MFKRKIKWDKFINQELSRKNTLKKTIFISLICFIPTYIMGNCQGKTTQNSIIASCQGESERLSLTKINKEIFMLNNDIFDEILRHSHTLGDIRRQLSWINNAGSILKQNNNLMKKNNNSIESMKKILYQQNISRSKQQELRRKLSIARQKIIRIREKNSYDLYQLEQQLSYSENQNSNLSSLLKSTIYAFSSELASSFSNYKKCAESNAILATYTIPDIQRERQKSSFSSGGYSQYSQVFSALSSSGISSYSLESCANEFSSLKNRFTLYEVTLNLLMSDDNRRRSITRNFFKVYRGKNATENDITRFIQNFKSLSTNNGLGNLIQNIDSYMQNY